MEVFDDPHSLECRHTLCLRCVEQLNKQGIVDCPECRTKMSFTTIKHDFRTAKLAESFKTVKDAGKILQGSKFNVLSVFFEFTN